MASAETAFVHLPHLLGRVIPPEESALRVTPEVLSAWDRRASELGRPHDWRLTDRELEASRRDALRSLPGTGDLWVFSYGSLMWDPGFHFAEVRRAELAGYQRRFTYRTNLGRGTPDRPALMLSLEPRGGACRGLAFRIAADLAEAESAILWRREMVRGGYRPAMLTVATPQGSVTALVFAANEAHPDHVGELPPAETAAIIASASGMLGTNRAYLEQLAEQLRVLGIDDPYVERILEHVRGTR